MIAASVSEAILAHEAVHMLFVLSYGLVELLPATRPQERHWTFGGARGSGKTPRERDTRRGETGPGIGRAPVFHACLCVWSWGASMSPPLTFGPTLPRLRPRWQRDEGPVGESLSFVFLAEAWTWNRVSLDVVWPRVICRPLPAPRPRRPPPPPPPSGGS